jgi:hypothetical protein
VGGRHVHGDDQVTPRHRRGRVGRAIGCRLGLGGRATVRRRLRERLLQSGEPNARGGGQRDERGEADGSLLGVPGLSDVDVDADRQDPAHAGQERRP